MPRFKVWFDHHEGVYHAIVEGDSLEEVQEAFQDDPFCICIQPEASDSVPVGMPGLRIEMAQALGVEATEA